MQSKKIIVPPPRTNWLESGIILLVLILFTLSFFMSGLFPRSGQIIFITVFLILAGIFRLTQAFHLIVLCFFWILIHFYFTLTDNWLVKAPLIISTYSVVVLTIPPLRKSVTWTVFGKFDKTIRYYLLGTCLISTMALIVWYYFARPDLSKSLSLLPDFPFWSYPFLAFGFASLNAFNEEIITRGIIMQVTDCALGAGLFSILFQAIFFGAIHFEAGFPRGVTGFILVTIYGIFLGFIRRRAGGMFAPWLTHVLADLVIFCILWTLV